MDGITVLKLIGTTIVPIAAAILFHLGIKKFKKFSNLNFWLRQLIIGVLFAIIAIGSFYFGPEYKDFTWGGLQLKMIGVYGSANAVPLIAGLLFGWPSGIICGFLASLYRLFFSPFGAGDFLRASECVSVLLAGFIAALLRKTLFDDKKPKWLYCLPIGLLIEVVHMSLSFMTVSIQKDIYYAYGVVSQADIACTIVVSVAITLSALGIAIIEREKIKINTKSNKISIKIQKWLGITFAASLVFATGATVVAFMRKQERDNKSELGKSLLDTEINLDNLGVEEMKLPTESPNGQLRNVFAYRHVGEEGYFIITDTNHKILATASNIVDVVPEIYNHYLTFKDDKHLTDYSEITINKEERSISGNSFIGYIPFINLEKKNQMSKYVCVWHKYVHPKNLKTYYLCALLPYDEAIINGGLSVRITVYLEVLVFIAIFAVIYTFIKHVVIKNIYKINNDLSLITQGNLNVKVNVRSNAEFASLSDDINHTVDTLKQYIDEANKRIDKELAFAKEIQYSSLPYVFPTTDAFDLHASMKTAKQVGGDFYDFFKIDNDHLMFLIADVSGKGIPAALFMMRAKTLVKSLATANELKLNDIITSVNDELCHNNDAMMFVTGWFGILNIKTGLLEFVNAGHNRPLVKQMKKGNTFRYLEMQKNFVLAGMENVRYKLETLKFEPGDEIYLYTDGVTEATSVDKKLYSDEKLLEFINSISYDTTSKMLALIGESVDEFQVGADQADDITMLAIRYKPSERLKETSITIKPNIKEISKAIDFITSELHKVKISNKIINSINVAVDDIISDAIIRTYKVKSGFILITIKVVGDTATITFKDNGRGYNPEERLNRASCINKNKIIDDEDIASLGLLYAKKTFNYLDYKFEDNKSVLTIKKKIKGE